MLYLRMEEVISFETMHGLDTLSVSGIAVGRGHMCCAVCRWSAAVVPRQFGCLSRTIFASSRTNAPQRACHLCTCGLKINIWTTVTFIVVGFFINLIVRFI
jgi:hypothetical protein